MKKVFLLLNNGVSSGAALSSLSEAYKYVKEMGKSCSIQEILVFDDKDEIICDIISQDKSAVQQDQFSSEDLEIMCHLRWDYAKRDNWQCVCGSMIQKVYGDCPAGFWYWVCANCSKKV